jgi:lysozyme family protein
MYAKYFEKVTKYFSKYPMYNAIVHLSGGIAIGILVARPFDQGHPLQLAAIFAVIAVIGHLIPYFMKKVK